MSSAEQGSEKSSPPRPSKPIVAIDARMVGEIPHGFARYVGSLAAGLSSLGSASLPYEPVFLVAGPGTPALERALSGFRLHPAPAPFLNPREFIAVPRALGSLSAALYHSPTFSSLLRAPCPWIVTVHDLNHLHYGTAAQRLYYRAVLRPFIRRSRQLVTVSEFSRRELAGWLRIPEERIELVTNALPAREPGGAPAGSLGSTPCSTPRSTGDALSRHGLEAGRYFLVLSNPKPHKNLGLVLRAYAKLESPAWPLVCSLRRGELPELPGLRALGPVAEAESPRLLASAGAVLCPSRYEGFGLVPVEAAAAQGRVIVSDIPPHREGLRDLGEAEACWVGPDDAEGWARAMREAMRGRLGAVSAGSAERIRARYDVRKIGRDMDRIYRRVLGFPGI